MRHVQARKLRCKKFTALGILLLVAWLLFRQRQHKIDGNGHIDSTVHDQAYLEPFTNQHDSKNSFRFTWTLSGYCFDENGVGVLLSSPMTSSLVHNVSSYVQREAKRRFVDPAGGNIFRVMSPSVTQHEGR